MKLYDFDDNLSFKLSLHDQYRQDQAWFKVDIYLLTVETCLASSSSDTCFLTSLDEKPKQTSVGEASWFKSLDCVVAGDDEFSFDFCDAHISAGGGDFPIRSLVELPFIYFPLHMVSRLFTRFRQLAREARAYKRSLKELEEQRQLERDELRRKQQQELQQKQKDLVQLALKRAQNAQSKKIVSPPPSAPVSMKKNVWSSSLASPVVPLAQPLSSQWSSRPIVPPAMTPWSSGTVPTISIQAAVMQADPWSTANLWTGPPHPKRVRTPAESDPQPDDQRQRMSRLGVPFRTNDPKQ